jgi:RNA polymerase sigma factor (sigma-70 family)
MLSACGESLVERLFEASGARSWGLTRDNFTSALAQCAAKHFTVPATPFEIERYLSALHLKDFALARACADGQSAAWEHFIATYRGYLRSAAAAILKCPVASPAACELADSLFADLYGLREGTRGERSLFRYFHGRSSLKTWLRAVLAQRHIDGIRASRRLSSLSDSAEDGEERASHNVSRIAAPPMQIDPHRQRYVALFTRTLEVALGLLDPRDRERLRLYYAEELTLAEIGRQFGEHESSVSRNLERTRRELRRDLETALRKGCASANGVAAEPGLSEEQLSLCFEYAAADAPIDLDKLFAEPRKQKPPAERQES